MIIDNNNESQCLLHFAFLKRKIHFLIELFLVDKMNENYLTSNKHSPQFYFLRNNSEKFVLVYMLSLHSCIYFYFPMGINNDFYTFVLII